jgi:orotidine-5'-phosphate decarboxylase
MSAGSSSASKYFLRQRAPGVHSLARLGLPLLPRPQAARIPNTVAKAVEALRPLAPVILTVHAAGGRAMLEAAKAAAPEGTKVVAVTVLTSLDANDLASAGVQGDVESQVERLGCPRP